MVWSSITDMRSPYGRVLLKHDEEPAWAGPRPHEEPVWSGPCKVPSQVALGGADMVRSSIGLVPSRKKF